MQNHTRINVRAVITNNDKVLLCHFVEGKTYSFFPGGGAEFTEGAEVALRRELQEELGVETQDTTFIGAVENLFDQDGKPYHELNLVFTTSIKELNVTSKEHHIAFTWMPIADLERENVLPKQLVGAVAEWFKDGKMFWVGLK